VFAVEKIKFWVPGDVARSPGSPYLFPLVHRKKGICSRWHFVDMYYFALDFQMEMPYPLAPPQGWEAFEIFENLANSKGAFSS
jgi:hypothetical protein